MIFGKEYRLMIGVCRKHLFITKKARSFILRALRALRGDDFFTCFRLILFRLKNHKITAMVGNAAVILFGE